MNLIVGNKFACWVLSSLSLFSVDIIKTFAVVPKVNIFPYQSTKNYVVDTDGFPLRKSRNP